MTRVAKLFRIPILPGYLAIQPAGGPVYVFDIMPVRKITARDLKPLPGHAGDCFGGDEAGPAVYRMYGLVKADKEGPAGSELDKITGQINTS